MNHKLAAFDENCQLSKHPSFQKNCCGYILLFVGLLSMNENIRLPINDISSNTNSFNWVYCFIKTSFFHHQAV
jgi:hypothetical protein